MLIHMQTATEIQRQLRDGVLEVPELAAQLGKRIQRLDSSVHAFVSFSEVVSNSAIGSKDGLLSGLPITVKDQIHVASFPITSGLRSKRTTKETSPMVQGLINAGATVIGKTSLPPYAMDFQTRHSKLGFCCNPWSLDFTSGGSSGGGASAVASGMSFLDIGADLAGSLRIPASFCGVYSLLPTEGLYDSKGLLAQKHMELAHFARSGPIARAPEDLSLIWQALSGERRCSIGQPLNLAVSQNLGGVTADRQIVDALKNAKAKWQHLKHKCEFVLPETFQVEKHQRLFGKIMGYETAQLMPKLFQWLAVFAGHKDALASPNFVKPILEGYRMTRFEYESALKERTQLISQILEFFEKYDAWILPVTAVTAFKHRKSEFTLSPTPRYLSPLEVDEQAMNYYEALTAYTTPIGLLGLPVVTMPLARDKNGLPFGVQIVGKPNSESQLLAIAEALTLDTSPWLDGLPTPLDM